MAKKKDNEMNALNEDGFSPLHVAALNGWRFQLPFLISKGADVHLKSRCGRTAYDIARSKNYTASAKYLKKEMDK